MRRQYNSRGYSQKYQNNGYNNYNQQIKKHSGAKEKTISNGVNIGKPCIVAWNYNKRLGLRSFLVTAHSKSKVVQTKKGKEYLTVMCTISQDGRPNQITNGFLDEHTGKVYLPELRYVINPKAPNGGYCGTYIMRKN